MLRTMKTTRMNMGDHEEGGDEERAAHAMQTKRTRSSFSSKRHENSNDLVLIQILLNDGTCADT